MKEIYGFSKNIGIKDIGFQDEHYHVELTIEPFHRNGHGILHGGVISTLLDAAMARATFNSLDEGVIAGVTLEMQTNFLKAKEAGIVTAIGIMIKKTKNTAFVEGKLVDEEGTLLAKSSATMMLSYQKKLQSL